MDGMQGRVFRRDAAGAALFASCVASLVVGFAMQVVTTRPVLPAPIDAGFGRPSRDR